MLCIGVDPGLGKSGVVVIDEAFNIQSQNLIQVRTRGTQRLVDIEMAFDSILRPYLSEELEVFIEGYAYGAKYQRESLAELGGVLRRYMHLARINFWVIPPTSLKLFVTENGKAKKNYMKKCTKEKWGQIFKSDDVCDAYGMSRLGMCILKTFNGENHSMLAHEYKIVQDIVANPEYYRNSSTARKRPKNDRRPRKT